MRWIERSFGSFLCLFWCVYGRDTPDNVLHRTPRQLLFPNSTLLQFNAGVGTPTPVKWINYNWAFQANFQLPWNRSQIPVDILWANSGYDVDSRKKRSEDEQKDEVKQDYYENDAKLYHFYKYVEDVLNGFGHNGSCCVRRALCRVAAEPLYPQGEDDLLHELASFVLNPTHDIIEDAPENVAEESLQYIEAYSYGVNSRECDSICDSCTLPVVDLFSILSD